MSAAVTLRLRAPFDGRMDMAAVAPDRLVDLDAHAIARLPVWIGRITAAVGEFFHVDGGRAADLRVEGAHACMDHLGYRMGGGRLLVDGDAGAHVAAEMSGGAVEVRGQVGDDAGLGMSGGTLHVAGAAGDRLGAALPGASVGMTGGEIVIGGTAGREAAARCRRGLIAIGGSTGTDAGRAMIAGTIVVFGRTEAGVGRGNKRGSIVAAGPIDVPDTYAYACTYEPPFVRLLLQYLRSEYGMRIDTRIDSARYRRYCGDRGQPGKGEILARERAS